MDIQFWCSICGYLTRLVTIECPQCHMPIRAETVDVPSDKGTIEKS